MCPFTRETFWSKDYTILTLRPGENAWQMFNAKTPPVAEYFHINGGGEVYLDIKPQQDKAHIVIFDKLAHMENGTAMPDEPQHILRDEDGPQIKQDADLDLGDDEEQSEGTTTRPHECS
jgi:hypothetical protein